ncbi:amidohydrolase family protein [Sinorhizobium meliloti]|nr:amidohydrolase family protein [Sinorhizobium meliloti]MDW9943438.1 amidohydrolase family protein [Sinorhizobium meliloti]
MTVHAFDADSHILEPRDLWLKYIDPKRRDLCLSIDDQNEESGGLLARRSYMTFKGSQLFQVCGSTPIGIAAIEALAGQADRSGVYAAARSRLLNVRDSLFSYEEQTPKAGYDPGARLLWMDRCSIEKALITPTWGAMWERYLHDTPDAIAANMEAYNRWILEFCGSDRRRLFPVGQISPAHLDWSLGELGALARQGVNVVAMRPVLYGGKTLSHPDFDRLWATLNDLNIAVYFHVSGMGTGAQDFFEAGWYLGENKGQHNGVIWSVAAHVPMMLTLTAMVRDGLFDQYRNLRLASVEHGAAWARPWLEQFDSVWDLLIARGFARPTLAGERPSQLIRKHVWFTALDKENLEEVVRELGSERIMFSTDYPHPECSDYPVEEFRQRAGSFAGPTPANFADL